MRKYFKKIVKDQKRILKLMYRKGVIDEMFGGVDDLGWEFLRQGKRTRRRHGKKYAYTEWIPELHRFTVDYWGEVDSFSLTDMFRDSLFWTYEGTMDENGNVSLTQGKPRYINLKDSDLIKHLEGLPTKRNDNKFNKYLIISR